MDFESGDKMKTFEEKISLEALEEFEDAIFGMCRLAGSSTELKYDILVDYFGSTKKISPRLLIDFNGHCSGLIPISIDEFNPKILVDRKVPGFDKVSKWVKKNFSLLIRHWNQEIYDEDLLSLLFYGVTHDEWNDQHHSLMTKYDNGEITLDEVLKVMRKEKEEYRNANRQR